MVEKYKIFTLGLRSVKAETDNPDIIGVFTHRSKTYQVFAFPTGNHSYEIRFSPDEEGEWKYRVSSPTGLVESLEGEFECTPAAEGNHGMVKVKDKLGQAGTEDIYGFQYADGQRCIPFGTTCYAWIYQNEADCGETLETLKESPFNKIRMCIFPKYYVYNTDEPQQVPFKAGGQGIDFDNLNYRFFDDLERKIIQLDELGIEADLILFHPYDKWGFSKMTKAQDIRYLTYVVRRLCHFKNVWWSMANEYDLMPRKSEEDWDAYAEIVRANDPYGHLLSIHNNIYLYDYRKPWITHCSIQRVDVYKTAEMITDWRTDYRKPVIVDECGYEGNMDYGWGNLTGEELVRRFWEGYMRGGYLSHGECFVNKGRKIWWSHGGRLYGDSVQRIAFLKEIMDRLPEGMIPMQVTKENHEEFWDCVCLHQGEGLYLYYLGFSKPLYRNFLLPENRRYKIELIDTWNMTMEKVDGLYSGAARIYMGERQYMAVRIEEAGGRCEED